MAQITYKTFLMFKRKTEARVKELCEIVDYPDLIPESGTIESTTLRDGMAKYVEDIKDAGGGFPFTINYDPAIISKVKAMKESGEEFDFEVWFGGNESGGVLTPTGEDGAVEFSGKITYQVTGAGTRAIRPSTITIFPTADPDWNEQPKYQLATVPTAPQNFIATADDGEVDLSWAAPANDGGSAITGYEVSKDGGATYVAASSNTAHTFTGLTNDQLYTFKVRAISASGNGAAATVTATPTA